MKPSKQHLTEASKTLKSIKTKLNESNEPAWVRKIQDLNRVHGKLYQKVVREFGTRDILSFEALGAMSSYQTDMDSIEKAPDRIISQVHEHHRHTIELISRLEDVLQHLKMQHKAEQDFLKSPNK